MEAALELVRLVRQVRGESSYLDGTARWNRILHLGRSRRTLRRSRRPDVEPANRPAAEVGDPSERVRSAALILDPNGLPLIDGEIRGLIAPRRVTNEGADQRRWNKGAEFGE